MFFFYASRLCSASQCLSLFYYSHLKHWASVKRFVSLQFLKPKTVDRAPWMGGSARRKASTYTNTEKTQTNIHGLSGV
jgi:hypothetical protein